MSLVCVPITELRTYNFDYLAPEGSKMIHLQSIWNLPLNRLPWNDALMGRWDKGGLQKTNMVKPSCHWLLLFQLSIILHGFAFFTLPSGWRANCHFGDPRSCCEAIWIEGGVQNIPWRIPSQKSSHQNLQDQQEGGWKQPDPIGTSAEEASSWGRSFQLPRRCRWEVDAWGWQHFGGSANHQCPCRQEVGHHASAADFNPSWSIHCEPVWSWGPLSSVCALVMVWTIRGNGSSRKYLHHMSIYYTHIYIYIGIYNIYIYIWEYIWGYLKMRCPFSPLE